jgi:hypothetical protein
LRLKIRLEQARSDEITANFHRCKKFLKNLDKRARLPGVAQLEETPEPGVILRNFSSDGSGAQIAPRKMLRELA